MAKKKARTYREPTQRRDPYQLLVNGQHMTFPDKQSRDRIKYIQDLFFSPGKDGKPQKTNLDLPVQMSADNPLLTSPMNALGFNVELKSIPTKEYNKKYKVAPGGFVGKVKASNPHVSPVKAPIKKAVEKTTTPPKTWVGPPYTIEELQPQNLRYLGSSSAVATDCLTCAGIPPMEVLVNDCDGNGPYVFPGAIFEDATPTNAILGIPVSCAPPGNTYNYPCQATCWGSQWIPIAVQPVTSVITECASLKQDPVCITSNTPTCAVPGAAQATTAMPSTSALPACTMIHGYITDGTPAGWNNVDQGVFAVPSGITSPGVGVQLMNDEDAWNMVNAAVSAAPFNLTGLASSQGSIAKMGDKIYTTFRFYDFGNIYRIVELEINPAGTSINFGNLYTLDPTPSNYTPGNSLCAKGVNTLLGNFGNDIYQMDLDPIAHTFTRSLLFTTSAYPAGDMVYDSTTDTIWIGLSGGDIVHYDINGNVLGTVSSAYGVVSMWCEAGEIVFYQSGDFYRIDKATYTLVVIHGTYPFYPYSNNGGDAASDPGCCGLSQSTTNCTAPGDPQA